MEPQLGVVTASAPTPAAPRRPREPSGAGQAAAEPRLSPTVAPTAVVEEALWTESRTVWRAGSRGPRRAPKAGALAIPALLLAVATAAQLLAPAVALSFAPRAIPAARACRFAVVAFPVCLALLPCSARCRGAALAGGSLVAMPDWGSRFCIAAFACLAAESLAAMCFGIAEKARYTPFYREIA